MALFQDFYNVEKNAKLKDVNIETTRSQCCVSTARTLKSQKGAKISLNMKSLR